MVNTNSPITLLRAQLHELQIEAAAIADRAQRLWFACEDADLMLAEMETDETVRDTRQMTLRVAA